MIALEGGGGISNTEAVLFRITCQMPTDNKVDKRNLAGSQSTGATWLSDP